MPEKNQHFYDNSIVGLYPGDLYHVAFGFIELKIDSIKI